MGMHTLSVDAQSLRGNRLGDEHRRPLVVYTPPSFEYGRRGHPLVVLLHGYGGRASQWAVPEHLRGGAFRPSLEAELDAVFADDVTEAVVAMPDGWTSYGGGQWVDSPVGGRFARFLELELVPLMERDWGVSADPSMRIVLGHSAGALGAWQIATTTAMFGALGFLAGDSAFGTTHLPWILDALTSRPTLHIEPPPRDDAVAMLAGALGASYSPAPDRAVGYDLPVDRAGRLVPRVWDTWLGFDPVVNAVSRRDALARLRRIRLDVGTRDEYRLQYGHRQLSAVLDRLGIDHSAIEFDGDHSSQTIQRIAAALRELLRPA
jgi:hypothetical protein